MLEVGLILWPVEQRKWKENVGERAKRGKETVVCDHV